MAIPTTPKAADAALAQQDLAAGLPANQSLGTLTAASGATVGGGYDELAEGAVIIANRTRIAEIERVLVSMGLLTQS